MSMHGLRGVAVVASIRSKDFCTLVNLGSTVNTFSVFMHGMQQLVTVSQENLVSPESRQFFLYREITVYPKEILSPGSIVSFVLIREALQDSDKNPAAPILIRFHAVMFLREILYKTMTYTNPAASIFL